jgi:hypothetical protein
VAGRIKLDLAQYRELAAFAQFGSDLDAKTQAQLERGKRIVELFKQNQYNPMQVEVQSAVLWAMQNNLLDDVPVEKVKDFQAKLTDFLASRKAEVLTKIRGEKAFSDALAGELKAAITEFKPAQVGTERFGLWEKDVVEVFIAPHPAGVGGYSEYEVAPNGEKLDVNIAPEKKDFEWSSGFECAVRRNEAKKIWTAEIRIPLASVSETKPDAGARWRVNFYRCDYANGAFLGWNPTLTRSFHAPERFGWLEFSAGGAAVSAASPGTVPVP